MPVNIMIMGEPPPQQTQPAQPKAPAPNGQAATRVVVLDACERAIKRLSVHARRAAEHPSKFLEWLDAFEGEHRAVLAEMLMPSVGLIVDPLPATISTATAKVITDFCKGIRADLLQASGECKAMDLGKTVGLRMDSHERYGAAALADTIYHHIEKKEV
jgi:hypothetical protein